MSCCWADEEAEHNHGAATRDDVEITCWWQLARCQGGWSFAKMKIVAKVLLSLGLGLAWWYGISYTIAAMSGAGHGWFGAVASIGSVFFLPVTGVGLLFRPSPWVRYVSLYVTVGCLLLDFIIGATIYSPGGRDGLGAVHEHAPQVLYAWEALWLLWHAAIVALWVRLLWRVERNAGLATPQSNSEAQREPPSVS